MDSQTRIPDDAMCEMCLVNAADYRMVENESKINHFFCRGCANEYLEIVETVN